MTRGTEMCDRLPRLAEQASQWQRRLRVLNGGGGCGHPPLRLKMTPHPSPAVTPSPQGLEPERRRWRMQRRRRVCRGRQMPRSAVDAGRCRAPQTDRVSPKVTEEERRDLNILTGLKQRRKFWISARIPHPSFCYAKIHLPPGGRDGRGDSCEL